MRYLETKEVTKIGGILFVAPWLDLLPKAIEDEESYNVAQHWINTPIDFEKIKQFTNHENDESSKEEDITHETIIKRIEYSKQFLTKQSKENIPIPYFS